MRQPTKGRVLQERVWRFIEVLLTQAENSSNFEIKWETDKDTGRPNFVVKTRRRFLESLAQLKKHEFTEVIKSLENLQIWDDRRLKQGQGSEIGSFALKLWSTDAQRNREEFERVWNGSRTAKSKALEATYKKSKAHDEASQDKLNWQDCCRKMLPAELSINPLLHGDGVELTLDDIVPLELVERKQQPQYEDDLSPDNFYKKAPTEYETPVEHSQFIAQVLETGDNLKNRDRKIAVIGEPGAGKTTLLQEIAQAAEKTGGLPIFVRLADLGEKTLKDYLLEDWLEEATGKRRIPEDIQDDFVEQFNLGRVWLLLDGVDEISATDKQLSNLEKQLKGWVSEARIVLTCRVNVWDVGKNNLYAFEKYRIQPLSYPGLVGDFIHRFFSKAGEQTKGEKLIEKLERSQPRIRDLVKNPLRLTLLCRTWKRRQGELPQTKAELYKGFVETFYEWKDKPELDENKRQLLEQALGELAKNAIDKETTKFRLRKSVVRRELDKFDKSLFDLACRVSWINHVGMAAENPDEPVYAFFHPTFQEYFAALAIDDWDFFLPRAHDNRNPKPVSEKYRIFEPQWKEVILLWLGREEVAKERKEEFIWRLARFKDGCGGFYHYRAYFLAAVGIAEFRDCSLADEIVEVILKCSFGYFNIEIQKWQKNFDIISTEAKNVLDVLAQTAHTKVIDVLTKQFPPDNLVSWEATLFLGKISDTNSTGIRALIDLLTSQYFLTRYEAAYSLARIGAGNQDIINSLTSLLNSTQDREIRLFVAWVLGKVDLGNQDALKALTELLHSSKDNETQLRVAEKLGEIDPGNTDAIKALIKRCLTKTAQSATQYPKRCQHSSCIGNPSSATALNAIF
ncbi:HEAT repeat domain-containing protein [Coleofasciculus sp. E1-EBD-02]|uniref:HEAT repeat domain-containing protein n=1 Tax=Coleofasciculus sp. E1-EBD-02 TaxID=3068481 RepID=UPI0032F7F37F